MGLHAEVLLGFIYSTLTTKPPCSNIVRDIQVFFVTKIFPVTCLCS